MKKIEIKKLGLLFIVLILCLAGIGISYSGFSDNLKIHGVVNTGEWGSCLCIRKTLDGSFTDPITGDDLLVPFYDLNLIHQSDNNNPGFPTKFKLTIEVQNNCNVNLTNMNVTDKIGNQIAPRQIIEITHGKVEFTPYGLLRTSFGHDFMNWEIGTLKPGEIAILIILIETLPNPTGKYEPTSEDQELPINDGGANVTATTPRGEIIMLVTEGITLDIDPYGTSENSEENDNLAIIASPYLPYSTPWVCYRDDFPYNCE